MKKWFSVLLIAVGICVTGFFVLRNVNTSKSIKVIAIANLMSHPILDSVQKNILEELKREGYEDGKNVRIILRNANGQMQVVSSIANELVAQKPDIIIAISTPVSQAVKKVAQCPV